MWYGRRRGVNWHGATHTTRVTHVAIVDNLPGQAVESMEQFSDEQYHR